MRAISAIQFRIKKIVFKKSEGNGELIAALFAVLGLVTVLFLNAFVVEDIQRITVVDQLTRQAVITSETFGKLSADQIADIENTLKGDKLLFDSGHSMIVNGATVTDGVYNTYKDASGKWQIDTANSHKFKYGDEVGVYIQCQLKTTKFENFVFNKGHNTVITRFKTTVVKKAM